MAVTLFESQYFATDHLGSVRVRTDWSGVTIHGRQNYYPFGDEWTPALPGDEFARFSFNGKERQTIGDLQDLDYGARMKPVGIPRWRTIDPLADLDVWSSPYVYMNNNPVRNIDPDGKASWDFDIYGKLVHYDLDYTLGDRISIVSELRMPIASKEFELGTLTYFENSYTNSEGEQVTYLGFELSGDKNGTELFNFMGNWVTDSESKVEYGHIKSGEDEKTGMNYVYTSNTKNTVKGTGDLLNKTGLSNGYVREINHSHPVTKVANDTDKESAAALRNHYKSQGLNIPNFNIYHAPKGKYHAF